MNIYQSIINSMLKNGCVFCRIIKGEIPSYKVYEDNDYLAFLDISQFSEGHTVIIPKNHIDFVWNSKDIGKYFRVVQKVANHFQILGYKYVDSLIFGRKVMHAHVHLIPHNNDGGDYKSAKKKLGDMQEDKLRRPTPGTAQTIADKFKL